MYSFRRLESQADFDAFKTGYESQIRARSHGRINSTVALDYLSSASHVVGCFDRSGRMVAGYVIQTRAPMIIPGAMPEDARCALYASIPVGELAELTAIWRDSGISSDRFAALVWPRIIFDCVVRGRRWILGIGYRNTMHEIYNRMLPRLIYHGPHQVFQELDIWVYAYTRPILVATFVTNLFVRKLIPLARRARR